MDSRNSDVNVPLFSSGGFFRVESVNGVTTVSLHHFPFLPSSMEADGIERPGMNFNCAPVVPVPSIFPISGQPEVGSDKREGCSSDQQNELNSEVPWNCEREFIRRDIYLPQQCTDCISQQGTENQVLQPECRKRLGDTLQLESTKKLKQNNLKSESLGWCPLCEIDCLKEVVLKDHILGKKHTKMLKKLKWRDIIGNPEKNDKQVKEVVICQKKHKESPKTMERSKDFSRVNDDNNKCAFADGRNTMSGLLSKKAKKKNVQRAKDDSISNVATEEFGMKENAELKEKQQMKGAGIPPTKHMSKKLQKFSKKECKICDVSVCSQADFELHIAGRKHAKMLKISEFSESPLKRKVNCKEYANAYDKEWVRFDYGSTLNDDVRKTVEVILERKDDGGLKADKNDINEFVNCNNDLKESGPSDYGPLIKDCVDKTAEEKNILELNT